MTSIAVNNNGDSDDFFDTASSMSAERQDAEQQHNEDGIPLPTTTCTTPNCTTEEYNMTHLISTTTDPSLQGGPPAGYFFKGYLAWCLWGHIPVIQGGYKSKLFTVAKENA